MIHCLNCTQLRLEAQISRDNLGTSRSNRFQLLIFERQQRPPGPVLISGIHSSSSHQAPHLCSDSAAEWIWPEADHLSQRKTAPPATPVGPAHQPLKRHESENHLCTALVTRMPHGLNQCSQQDVINSCIHPQQGTMHGKELNCHYAK